MNDDTGVVAEEDIPRPESKSADSFGLSPGGWHPAHDKPGFERFWNGTSWTKRTRAADPELELIRQDDRMLSFAWFFSAVLPWSMIGFVLGAILVLRGRRIEAGIGMMFLTIVMSVFWYTVLVSLATISFGAVPA